MIAPMTDEELMATLAEMYPGESPSNEDILTWVHETADKAWKYDGLVEIEQEARYRHR
jgi:hypothetical protein